MPRYKLNQWTYACTKCNRKVITYVPLTEAICTNHSLGKPVYMVLTSEPPVDTTPEP